MDAQNKYRRIVIKVGSNVLTRDDGRPDTTRISALVDQVARLHRAGTEVILVSSGAVASGRSILERRTGKLDSVSARQLFSAVGQVKLLNRYYDLFNEYGIVCGQVLTTKESLSTRRQYLNQRNCMETMLANGVLPIVNENDTISVTELMFTDNDELSGLVAAMMNAEALIILSNIDGIYDGSPADPASQVIRRVKPSEDLSQYIDPVRSSRGRGGMATKSRVSSRAAAEGIEVIIANGRRDGILTDLVLTGEEVPCTASNRLRGQPRASRNGSPAAKASPRASCTSTRAPPQPSAPARPPASSPWASQPSKAISNATTWCASSRPTGHSWPWDASRATAPPPAAISDAKGSSPSSTAITSTWNNRLWNTNPCSRPPGRPGRRWPTSNPNASAASCNTPQGSCAGIRPHCSKPTPATLRPCPPRRPCSTACG